MANENKRRGLRRGLFYYLKAARADGSGIAGHLVNLTDSGLMLMMEQAASPGDRLAILLDLPPGFETWSPLALDLVCRWNGPSVTPGYRDVGFEFLDKSLVNRTLLARLLDEVGFTGS
ncbi:MAG: PilZ domain-containing protein [Spirochaetes bacterium]|nr:PilZ domain-containing protein [Spirochaetota bacterium]